MRKESLTEALISHCWWFLDIQNIANNDTAQKMKFSIKGFSVNVTKSEGCNQSSGSDRRDLGY